MKKFVGSLILLIAIALPAIAGDNNSITSQTPVQEPKALSVEPIKLGGLAIVAPKFILEGTGEYKLPEFVEVRVKMEGAKPPHLASVSYDWRIFEHVVENGFISESDLRVKAQDDKLSFYAVVDNKRYNVTCTITCLYVIRDAAGKVSELATKSVFIRGIVTVGNPPTWGPRPSPSPEPQPGPRPGPQPNPSPEPPTPVSKQKLIVVIVSDLKSPSPEFAELLRSKTMQDKLTANGHEFKSFNSISPDIQKNGVAAAIANRKVDLPALVLLKADGDRGAIVNVLPCPTTEAEVLTAVSKHSGGL